MISSSERSGIEQFKFGQEGDERKEEEDSLACVGVLLNEWDVRRGDDLRGVLLPSDLEGERDTSVTLSLEGAGMEVGVSFEAVGDCLVGASLE